MWTTTTTAQCQNYDACILLVSETKCKANSACQWEEWGSCHYKEYVDRSADAPSCYSLTEEADCKAASGTNPATDCMYNVNTDIACELFDACYALSDAKCESSDNCEVSDYDGRCRSKDSEGAGSGAPGTGSGSGSGIDCDDTGSSGGYPSGNGFECYNAYVP